MASGTLRFLISGLEMFKKSENSPLVSNSIRQLSFGFLDHSAGNDSPGEVEGWKGDLRAGRDSVLSGRCVDLLDQLELPDLKARISVEWNPRMRSAAGRAFWPQGLIQLNSRLAEISPSEVERTVLHELAHLIAYERHPRRAIKSHGREWRRACAEVGIPNEKATHQLELPTRTMRRKWRYQCPACTKIFDRVHRFKQDVACYECCRKTRDGSYDERFRLVERRLEP